MLVSVKYKPYNFLRLPTPMPPDEAVNCFLEGKLSHNFAKYQE